MEEKIKKEICSKLDIKTVRKAAWEEVYSKLLEVYSELEILEVIEKYSSEVIFLMDDKILKQNTDKVRYFANGLISKRDLYFSEKMNRNSSGTNYTFFIPNEFKPNIDGVQKKNKESIIQKFRKEIAKSV